jgi:two-component system cell cycle response regulator DivK
LLKKEKLRRTTMGINVLYVEDNPDNMVLVKRVMEAAGYTLFQAATGLDGLAIAEKEAVDLILLDINLPDIDGYEVARRLRRSTKSSLAHIPIIAITANALKGDAESALAAGCDVYMSKPVNIHELRARVEGFVPFIETHTKQG